MRISWTRWVVVAGALLACEGADAPDTSERAPFRGGGGGDGGGAAGTVLPGGSGGGGAGGAAGGSGGTGGIAGSGGEGGAGTGGSGGEGGIGGMGAVPVGIPYDPDWGPCRSGPPRRPATGTALVDPDAPFRLPPLQTEVEHYVITMPPASWEALQRKPREDTMYGATFEARGERHDVLVRFRGNSSRGWPKKSWRVELPEGTRFDGRRKLNLISGWRDSTLVVEKLGYDLLAAMNFPAPRARYVRLTVNGQYQGVYLDLERVDKNFLVNHELADKDATIYRCGMKDCEFKLWSHPEFQEPWEKMTNESDPTHVALEQFLCAVNATPEPELVEVLEQRFELELHLRTMVMEALISSDTVEDSRSYVSFDAMTGRMLYVPWDLNNSTTRFEPGHDPGDEADYDHPLFLFTAIDGWSEIEWQKRKRQHPSRPWHPMSSNLNNRIVFHPELRARLIARLEKAMAELFREDLLGPRFDQIHALLRPWVVPDVHVDTALFDDGPRYLREYVRNRTAFLRTEIERVRALGTGLVLDAVDPESGWVTVRNRGGAPIALGQAVLSTNLRGRPLVSNLPMRTLQPGESFDVALVTLGLHLDIPGELALWSAPDAGSLSDLFYVGEIPAGRRYERDEDGNWQIR